MQPKMSRLIVSKACVETAREMLREPPSKWSTAYGKDAFEPSIRDDMLRGFSLGFTAGSLACGISAPFIVATYKASFDVYDKPMSGEKMRHERKKLIGLATLGAPGLAVGSVLGGVCALGGGVVGGVKKFVYKMAQT